MYTERMMEHTQKATPILDALLRHWEKERVSVHVPGHKAGQGLPDALADYARCFARLDATELPGLDDLHAPRGAIRQAEQLAARAWGSDSTFFLVGGSTAGNLAAILATLHPGDQVVVPRNAHQSVWHGLKLARAHAIVVTPEPTPYGVPGAVPPERIARALEEFPRAAAIVVISPTYHGITSDLPAIVRLGHACNIPVIVDEAHGAHLSFHPQLPISGVQAGADIVVQSAHKMLSALTQTALLHLNGARVDPGRLRDWLRVVQSSSPSYLLLASLDCARAELAALGEELIGEAIQRLTVASGQIEAVLPGLINAGVDGARQDPFKWTVAASRLGMSGYETERLLRERFGIYAELAHEHHVLFAWSYANTQRDVDAVSEALRMLALEGRTEQAPANADMEIAENLFSDAALSEPILIDMQEDFSSAVKTVPLRRAAGRRMAQSLTPYPPGIPCVLPGETLSQSVSELILRMLDQGVRVDGLADSDSMDPTEPKVRCWD
ncbi:MAG: aminotransferase class I/II-fold pyridoxal phosphate-dependent enzyme [Bacilli bacterium]